METLWRTGAASRAEIAGSIGLSNPAVTQITRLLTDKGLIEEQVPRRGQRGQPARPLMLKADAGFGVGVNFSHSYVEVGIVDLVGHPLSIKKAALLEPSLDAISHASFQAIDELCSELSIKKDRLLGVGFCVPGDFATDGGLTAHVYFPDLFGRKMQAELAGRTQMQVFVENDGKASAIGELIIGAGRSARSFLVVHIGHGIGGGIVIDGKLQRGSHGNAGPLGGFYPVRLPRPSGQDLLETLFQAGNVCHDFDRLDIFANAPCQALTDWIDRAAQQLKVTLKGITALLDPQIIVLGGRLPPQIFERLCYAINQSGEQHSPWDVASPQIVPSLLGSEAGVIGAALLPIHAHLFPR